MCIVCEVQYRCVLFISSLSLTFCLSFFFSFSLSILGPNHLGNMCDAPMFALADFSDIYLQPKYYYFGHVSKFVRPGFLRVASSLSGDFGFLDSAVNMAAG